MSKSKSFVIGFGEFIAVSVGCLMLFAYMTVHIKVPDDILAYFHLGGTSALMLVYALVCSYLSE